MIMCLNLVAVTVLSGINIIFWFYTTLKEFFDIHRMIDRCFSYNKLLDFFVNSFWSTKVKEDTLHVSMLNFHLFENHVYLFRLNCTFDPITFTNLWFWHPNFHICDFGPLIFTNNIYDTCCKTNICFDFFHSFVVLCWLMTVLCWIFFGLYFFLQK
jgi:hypothetical protein